MIALGYTQENEDLVAMIKAIGMVAVATGYDILIGEQKKERIEERQAYVGSLVEDYVDSYIISNNMVPSRALFDEAINQYVTENFKRENVDFSETIKDMMKEWIISPLERYERQLNRSNYVQKPDYVIV